MNIFITTPNGKVGSEVINALIASGQTPVVGVHRPESAKAFGGKNVRVLTFDYAKPEGFAAALGGIEVLYLAFPGTSGADQPKQLVDAAKNAGVKRIVMLSAQGVEGSDTALWAVEQHIAASGLEYTVLRPTWFFQNFNTGQAYYIKHLGAIIEASADAKTSFIDARDIAAVAVKAILENGHSGKAYTLTGAVAHSRDEVAAAISQATGKAVRYIPKTDEEFRAQAQQEQWDSSVVEMMSWLYAGVRNGWTVGTTNTVQEVLGRAPIGLAQYAQDHRDAWL
jgi:uncharacterized protein YbjT (DUF2867 family)